MKCYQIVRSDKGTLYAKLVKDAKERPPKRLHQRPVVWVGTIYAQSMKEAKEEWCRWKIKEPFLNPPLRKNLRKAS